MFIVSLFVLALSQSSTTVRTACSQDLQNNCQDLPDDSSTIQCLKQHWPNLESACSSFIADSLRTRNASTCDADVLRLCAADQGFTSVLVCLRENVNQLSSDCQQLLESRPRHHRDHRDHDDHDDAGSRHRDHDGFGRDSQMAGELNASCHNEIATFCPTSQGRSLMKCLRRNRDSLSKQCAITLSSTEDEHHRGRVVHTIAVVAVVIVVALCVARGLRKCRRHRHQYRMMVQQQQPQVMVAMPPMVHAAASAPSSSPAPAPAMSSYPIAAPIPAPGVVYSAGPSYTGTGYTGQRAEL